MQKKGTALFESAPIPKAVAYLSIPTVLSSIVSIVYGITDTFFVGLLNDPVQSAAIALSSSVTLAFIAVQNLFGIGGSSLMGRYLGSGRQDKARESAAFALWGTIIAGAVYSLIMLLFQNAILNAVGASGENRLPTLRYLRYTIVFGAIPSILNVVLAYITRTAGKAPEASIGTTLGCVINIILDPIFILPKFLGLGAAGAGMATLIGNCAACGFFLIVMLKHHGEGFFSFDPRKAFADRKIALGVSEIGIPAAVQNLLNVAGMTVLNKFAAGYGDSAVAAMGISFKIYFIPMQICNGLSGGILPLLSYNCGNGNMKRVRQTAVFTGAISVGFMLIMAAFSMIRSDALVRLFIDNDEIVRHGGALLRRFVPALPFLCLDFLGITVFQSCGKGRLCLFFAILRKAVLEIPCLMLLNRVIGLYGLPFAFVIEEVICFCAVAVSAYRLLNKKEPETDV